MTSSGAGTLGEQARGLGRMTSSVVERHGPETRSFEHRNLARSRGGFREIERLQRLIEPPTVSECLRANHELTRREWMIRIEAREVAHGIEADSNIGPVDGKPTKVTPRGTLVTRNDSAHGSTASLLDARPSAIGQEALDHRAHAAPILHFRERLPRLDERRRSALRRVPFAGFFEGSYM
jgi:hypothetical protein